MIKYSNKESCMETWIGIDISKDTFDAAWEQDGKKEHEKFSNTTAGFKALLKWVPDGSKFVMEATGTYHLRCATFLAGSGLHVSVENPLAIKRFIQSDLRRCKNDVSDSFSIAKYGREKSPRAWTVPSEEAREARRLQGLIELLREQISAQTNYFHALQQEDLKDDAQKLCKASIAKMKVAIADAEDRFKSIVSRFWKDDVERISSIPGVGKMSACKLIAKVEDFNRFEDSRQFMSWLGMTPRNMQSGTSIHVNGGITKMGDGRLRTQFYMCAISAIQSNGRCRAMYERMVSKGKPVKVALVAVACKLLKTAYALVTKKQMYNANFLQFAP